MIELSWSIEGEKQISRRLDLTPYKLGNFTEPLMRIGVELKSAVDSNYSSRGALFGAKWKKRKDKNPWPLLEKTGAMRHSFEQRLGPSYLEMYNTADYFRYHQSNKPRGTALPRRVMLKIDKIRKVFIVKEFQRHLQNVNRNS